MILVLGANGNVGTLLVQRLVRSGIAVAGALRPGRERPTIEGALEWREVDLERPETLRGALGGVRTVVWTPGVKLLPPCLRPLEESGVGHVVIVSSASVHTRLESGGARAKRDAEARLRESRLPFTVIRPTMIYGNRRDRNLTRLLDWLERVPVFPLFGDGRALMQPVYIGDVAESLVRATERTPRGRFYDLGGAESISYRQLLDTAGAALGVRPLLVPVPLALSVAAVRWAGRLGVRALRDEQVLRLAEDKVVDNGPIRAELGIEPITFAEGIARQVAERRAERPREASVALPGRAAS
jgi:uncharacterized protein YbjT (DUF2867 family)